ncbi:phasin family protein [Marinicaulis aureus]|uniref:Phasin family protein n=1 Tax=Hyphococcus aureus TaxID=2666033 RepID=A0ABW1L353_9PROT|nr:hypothetical protein [Parvularcula sp.]
MTVKTAQKTPPRGGAAKSAASTKSGETTSGLPPEFATPDFAAPNFAAVVGAQMDGAKVMGEVSSMLASTAQDLASRQTAFVKSTMETIQKAAAGASEPNIVARLAHQSDSYRELMEASAQHVSDVAETVASCCCDAVDHITEAGARIAEKTAAKPAD